MEGKLYAWRVDDITWENDIAAYRVYGPALAAHRRAGLRHRRVAEEHQGARRGRRYRVTWQSDIDKAFFRSMGNQEGVDFVDRTTSYHLDHGQGLDCYNVGRVWVAARLP